LKIIKVAKKLEKLENRDKGGLDSGMVWLEGYSRAHGMVGGNWFEEQSPVN